MSATAPAASAVHGVHRWRALGVCLVALFMTLLDLSITIVALPAIGASTGAGPSGLQWVVSGYTLSFGLVPVLGGRLGDDHGRRRMFMVGVGGFVVTSALAGAAPGAGLLIAARVVQGIAGGLINPQVSGLVQQMFAPTERGRPFGLIGTVVGVGTALGPVLGGLLIALGGPDLGWRLVFFVNVPIGLACLVLARRWLPGPPPRETARRRPLDVPGALLLGLAVFCVLFAAVQYDALRDPRLAWLVVPALGFGTLFVRWERRLTRLERDPLFDLRLFTLPTYTTGVVLALFFFTAHTGIPLVLALYYQDGLGYSALQSGLGVTALAAGSALSAASAGRLADRWGRPLVLGALGLFWVGVGAVIAVALTGPGTHVALLLAVPLLVLGAGSGGVITPNQALSLRDVDSRTGSTAGGVLQTSQRMGAALGQALVGAAFFLALPRGALGDAGGDAGGLQGAARDAAYGDALATAATVSLGFVTLAFVVGVVDLRLARRRRRRSGTTPTPVAGAAPVSAGDGRLGPPGTSSS